ncbi:endo-1,4-beta-xylanase [Halocatena pleomorpha]|uniref:GH10 domain-containing protein n=1 Tax=Halocatena pleomorpha TaxID=1785090 RepID=A0A3P3RDA1_9EURY|nr:endo-1,4-beta-xylanase [Halocatena pleomorpha]RRJ31436.1 hypothetical protein EIK79_06885 [Halocatena pleomorpha]
MTDNNSHSTSESDGRQDNISIDRRGYLQTLGALGVLGVGTTVAGTPTAAAQVSSELLNYDGRSDGAEWRETAQKRIEEIRKTDIEVEVIGPGGQPMDEATVDIEMAEHEFDFGSAVSVSHITGDGEDDAIYRETFRENFNKAVIENGLKYPSFLGPWGDSKAEAKATLDWLNEHDVPSRGHYLVWEGFDTASGGGMSIDESDSRSPEELQQLIVDRIQNHALDVGDRVTEWDMHNHPIWQSNFRDRDGLGWDAVLGWWNAGEQATDADLYTNEMGNVAGDFFRQQHYDFVKRLLADGASVDGVGFMGHVQLPNGNVTPPKEMLSTFDQFAKLDLPVLITEFDVQIERRNDEKQVDWQVDFVRDFLTAAFSHEAVEGVMSWGFWAGDHWRPTGAYYNEDWTLRPHGEKYMDLVFDEWWTDENGKTDDNGRYTTRGFKGSYKVTAKKGSLSGEDTVTFDDTTETVRVELVPPGRNDSNASPSKNSEEE